MSISSVTTRRSAFGATCTTQEGDACSRKTRDWKNRTWNRLWWSSISMLRWLRKLHLRNSAICSRNFGRREIEIRVREVQDTWRPNFDDTELLRTTVYQKHSSMQRSNSMYIEWPLTNVRLLWVASHCLSPEVPINVGCNYNDQPRVPTPSIARVFSWMGLHRVVVKFGYMLEHSRRQDPFSYKDVPDNLPSDEGTTLT